LAARGDNGAHRECGGIIKLKHAHLVRRRRLLFDSHNLFFESPPLNLGGGKTSKRAHPIPFLLFPLQYKNYSFVCFTPVSAHSIPHALVQDFIFVHMHQFLNASVWFLDKRDAFIYIIH
jgi:hypothetical protein